MLERKLKRLIEKARMTQNASVLNDDFNYYNESVNSLSKFIMRRMRSFFFRSRNAKIIADYFDEILPFIIMSNIDILLLYSAILVEQPNFKEKFISGLKKYPYKNQVSELFYNMMVCFNSNNCHQKYIDFLDEDVLSVLAAMNLNRMFYLDILNMIDEEKQRMFLVLLAENKADIYYSGIDYKGNNKQIIFDNLPLFMENAQNLYNLMRFVRDDSGALSEVKKFIDSNEDKAINSIFCETDSMLKITDPVLKDVIKLLVLDVMKNENVKFSDITYREGGFSRVLLIGEKVIKLGSRFTKSFPNNPYIISPLLRKEIKSNDQSCFVEVTERVDTSIDVSREEFYQLYKNLRDLGLVWTDIKGINVGRLRRDNIIHWNRELNPSDDILSLDSKRGDVVLKRGDLVILDADFIYDVNNPNINYTNCRSLTDEFEARYLREKSVKKSNFDSINVNDNSDIIEKNFHR